MAEINPTRIRSLITNHRTGKLLSSFTVRDGANKLHVPIVNGRYVTNDDWHLAESAYYCWRMARFHGGVDMSMPVIAGVLVHGHDREELDQLDAVADALAVENFGSHYRAALTWGRALGL